MDGDDGEEPPVLLVAEAMDDAGADAGADAAAAALPEAAVAAAAAAAARAAAGLDDRGGDSDDDGAPRWPPTPVTVISGFLGAGKTTFVRRVVQEGASSSSAAAGGRPLRVAVLQNEVGAATGVDEALVVGTGSGEHVSWVELANGCACCTVKDDVLMAVEELARRGTTALPAAGDSGSDSGTTGEGHQQQQQQQQRVRFDHILLECSGMADPGALASSLWVDPALDSTVYLDAVVTFVDAFHITRHLDGRAERPSKPRGSTVGAIDDGGGDDGEDAAAGLDSGRSAPTKAAAAAAARALGKTEGEGDAAAAATAQHATEAYRQVAFADRLVINKRDLVDAETLERLTVRLRAINATAPVLHSERSNVPLDSVLGIRAFDQGRFSEVEVALRAAAAASSSTSSSSSSSSASSSSTKEGGHDHSHDHDHDDGDIGAVGDHSHDDRVRTELVSATGEVDVRRLEAWLGSLVWDNDLSLDEFDRNREREMLLYRYKGLIAARGEPLKYALQGVHATFEIEPTEQAWAPTEERASRIVFIGIGLNRQKLSEGLQRVVAESAT